MAWVAVGVAGASLVAGSLMAPDAPDYSGMNAAAVSNAALSKEQLDWYKQIYADTAPDRAAASERSNAISDAQLASMKQQTSIAADYDKYAKQTYRPLENQIVAASQNYDTTGRRDAAAGAATGAVQQQWTAAQEAQSRDLARQGVDPNSGRALAMRNQNAMGLASAQAGAATAARNQVETTGFARKMDAASLGRNLASSQSTAAGLALNAGNSSAANSLNSLTPGNQSIAQMQGAYNGAVSANASAGSIFGSIASGQNQAIANNNQQWTAAGQAFGSIYGSKVAKPV